MKLNIKRSLVFLLILTLMSSVMPFAFAEESRPNWVKKAAPKNFYDMSASGNHTISVTYNNKIFVFGGKKDRTSESEFIKTEMYDFSTNQWYEKSDLPIERSQFDAVLLNHKAYLVGGNKNGHALLAYDFASDTWETKSPVSESPETSEKTTVEVIDGKIYLIQGSNGTLNVYDPQTDTWERKASMSMSKNDYQTEVVNGKLYVIGGEGLQTLEEYNPSSNTWITKKAMPAKRDYFSTGVVDGKIFVIGGRNGVNTLKTMSEYDPVSNEWTNRTSMTDGRFNFQVIAINQDIYVLGGSQYVNSTSNQPVRTVEKYNIDTNKWESLPSLSYSRSRSSQPHFVVNSLFIFSGSSDFPEMYSIPNVGVIPTFSVTADPNKVKVGNQFTTTVAIHNVSNIYAEDIKIDYDTELFEYVGASAKDGLKIYKEDTSIPGSVRFIVAHLGQGNEATGDKDLIELTFKAKSIGIGKVDIVKGRIADNDTLEMDVAEENCGEDTIEVEANRDVNRTGEYTLLDLGIDAYYYGMEAAQTDNTRFDTDVIPDGIIDDKDLVAITQSILSNSNYALND